MLTSGYDVIQQQIEKQKSRGGFVRLNNIFWRDKDRKIIRHLHDDPAIILSHDFVKCADGSEKSFTCRKSLVEVVESGLKITEQPCPVCLIEVEDDVKGKHFLKPRTVAWGIAAMRQLDPSSHARDIIDVMEEVEIPVPGKEGETQKLTIPQIGVISQSLTNFWNHFANYMVRYRTTMDRDYEVIREGGGRGKGAPAYTVMTEDSIENMKTPAEVQEHYKVSLQGKTPRELLADRINFFGSFQYMSKHLGSDVVDKVEWPDTPQATEDKKESLSDHPGGLDEFAAKKDEEPQTFDSLKSRLSAMAKPKE